VYKLYSEFKANITCFLFVHWQEALAPYPESNVSLLKLNFSLSVFGQGKVTCIRNDSSLLSIDSTLRYPVEEEAFKNQGTL